ncbi:MAG: PIG-L family deacetylase [Acidimicrobiales bacterium]
MAKPRLLGVFAHPDDEVFCAGGTFARYVAEGAEAMVVSATRGQAGQIRDAGAATRRTLADVRTMELEAACAALGVQHVRCFDHQDGTLTDVEPNVVDAEIRGVFDEFHPDVVITFGDDGAYGHPDHVTISRSTTGAFARTYGTAGPARLYHSHFPRSRLLLLDRLATWLVELGERFKGSTAFAQALSLFAHESTTMGFASDHVDTRWAPAGTYLVEQHEPATSLHFILSGEVDVIEEQTDGTVQTVRRLGPGEFFGELGVVARGARTASVVAVEPTTCLVMSPGAPTLFEGRGEDARLVSPLVVGLDDATPSMATTVVDVTAYVEPKITAIAAHRTQFPIDTDMFPLAMLEEMFGREYFVRVLPPLPAETALLG